LSPAYNLQWLQNSALNISWVFGFTILTLGLRYTSPPISCLANLQSPKRQFADGWRELIGLEFGLSHCAMWPRALMLKRYELFWFFVFWFSEMWNFPLDNSTIQIFLWSDGPDLMNGTHKTIVKTIISIQGFKSRNVLDFLSTKCPISRFLISQWMTFPVEIFLDFFYLCHAPSYIGQSWILCQLETPVANMPMVSSMSTMCPNKLIARILSLFRESQFRDFHRGVSFVNKTSDISNSEMPMEWWLGSTATCLLTFTPCESAKWWDLAMCLLMDGLDDFMTSQVKFLLCASED